MKAPTTLQSLLSGGSTGGRGLGIWTLMTLGSGLSMEATPGPPTHQQPDPEAAFPPRALLPAQPSETLRTL